MMRPFWALVFVVVAAARPAPAQEGCEALWIRYPAISPDGTKICFSHRGDLWIVPRGGGEARRLTVHEAWDRAPVWSPDGRTIAFQSARFGNLDVFTVPAGGGSPTRLTFHSNYDLATCFTPDGKGIVFTSLRLDAPQAMQPTTSLPEVYVVPVAGGRPKQLLTTAAELATFSRDGGRLAYQDRKGYENEWRKHHCSSVARDIWVWESSSGTHTRLTTASCEDRNPVWSPDGAWIYYLSESSGNFNVWRMPAKASAAGGDRGKPAPAEQVTSFGPHPVRFLSIADDGMLAFAYDGELYTMAPGAKPAKVRVLVSCDDPRNAVRTEVLREGATAFAVSPDESEVAFVVRGEVFVASVEHGTTRRVTSTPEQERTLSWAPDGRSLYYDSERGGAWGLYKCSLARAEETHFFNATRLSEEPVLVGEDEIFQPAVSPDGKALAFLRNRDAIDVIDVATKATRNVVPADRNYSYADGDIRYAWSPDSKWLAFTYVARKRWIADVGVADVATGALTNATESGYEEDRPQWSPDGRALFFVSDRLGRRSHGSYGADNDLFAQYLTQESFDRAQLSREDFDLLQAKEGKAKEKSGAAKKPEGKEKDAPGDADAKKPPPEPVLVEFARREHRVRRATVVSSPIGGYAVSRDGESVVHFARVGEKWDLWIARPRDKKSAKAVELGEDEPGEVVLGSEGKTVFVLTGSGKILRANVASLLDAKRGGDDDGGGGGARAKPVAFAAEMTIDGPAERAYMFEHAWRQAGRKFYDPKLHGVDWIALKAVYARFLPHVANNHDFAELLSEMLGELNASHTGAGHRPKSENEDRTAALGLLWDTSWEGDGLRVGEVVAGGPCAKAGSKVRAGTLVTAIDGIAMTPAVDPASALNRKEGKPVLLDLKSADGGSAWQEVVKPVSLEAEANLLYERWIERCRETVAKASAGRAGYVHVRGMNEASFRRTFSEVLGRHADCEALVVDTRFNGGGNLHEDLVAFLGGREYMDVVPRGKARRDFGFEPGARWTRPAVVLMSEGNYSDAHIFPYAFKALGLGKLVGAPVAGTGTAVWWERMIDSTVVFGIPQVGLTTPQGRYLENFELDPDVLVYPDPKDVAAGTDAQLLEAVRTVLAEVKAR